jgi:hypothetical protein
MNKTILFGQHTLDALVNNLINTQYIPLDSIYGRPFSFPCLMVWKTNQDEWGTHLIYEFIYETDFNIIRSNQE